MFRRLFCFLGLLLCLAPIAHAAPPRRIVSLSPGTTEMLFALGAGPLRGRGHRLLRLPARREGDHEGRGREHELREGAGPAAGPHRRRRRGERPGGGAADAAPSARPGRQPDLAARRGNEPAADRGADGDRAAGRGGRRPDGAQGASGGAARGAGQAPASARPARRADKPPVDGGGGDVPGRFGHTRGRRQRRGRRTRLRDVLAGAGAGAPAGRRARRQPPWRPPSAPTRSWAAWPPCARATSMLSPAT